MRTMFFILAISALAIAYAGSNFVVISRVLQSLPAKPVLRWTVGGIMVALALAYIAGRFLERGTSCGVAFPFIWSGSVWFAILTYAFLVIVAGDLALGLAGRLAGALPWIERGKDLVPLAGLAVAVLVSAYGAWNAGVPRVTRYDITIPRAAGAMMDMDIALVTDIHMGHVMANSRVERIVDTVNRLQPDLVLLAGDVVDEDIRPVMEKNTGRLLTKLKPPLGVYACTGNHEYIGGVEPAVAYLEQEGVTFLRDEAVKLADAVWVVGREDRAARYMAKRARKDLADILIAAGVDRREPVIVMDHQPHGLAEAAALGVDLQVSGHTHNGQLWPFNYITGAIFEQDWGITRKGDTRIIVSCGAGTWGPPVKVGSISEIVHIHITFDPEAKTIR